VKATVRTEFCIAVDQYAETDAQRKEVEVLECILMDGRMEAQMDVATKEGPNGQEMRRRKYRDTIDIVSSADVIEQWSSSYH
jgi:hypothetical protein